MKGNATRKMGNAENYNRKSSDKNETIMANAGMTIGKCRKTKCEVQQKKWKMLEC